MLKWAQSRSRVLHQRRAIIFLLCAAVLMAFTPLPTRPQGGPVKLVATGDAPPTASYSFSPVTPDNNNVFVNQLPLGRRAIRRLKLLRAVTSDHQLNSAKDIAFAITDANFSMKGSIFISRGSNRVLQRIVQIGDPTPDGKVFTNFQGLSMNEAGDLLVIGETSGPSPSPGLPDSGLYLWRNHVPSLLLKAGDMSPLGPMVSFSNPRLTNNGHIYFEAKVNDPQGGFDEPILKFDGQTVQVVVKKGDQSNTGEMITTPHLGAVNNAGTVAFIDGSPGSMAVYLITAGRITRVVKEGDPIPGTRNTFTGADPFDPFSLSPGALGADNALAFVGIFRSGPNSYVGGLYHYDQAGGIRELTRTGRQVSGVTLYFLANAFVADGGVVYCGASYILNNTLNSAVLRSAQNQLRLTTFPDAGPTIFNRLPPIINQQGDALYERLELKVGTTPVTGAPIIPLNFISGARVETILANQSAAPSGSKFYSFPDLAVNNNGVASYIGNVAGGRHLLRLQDGAQTVLVRQNQMIDSDTIFSITRVTQNDQGVIAFLAEHDSGSAIFTISGSNIRKVISSGMTAVGTPGDPSSLVYTELFELSINSGGQVAFIANLSTPTTPPQLVNVSQAIFLAQPLPGGYAIQQVVDLSNSSLRIRNTPAIYFSDLTFGHDGTIVFIARAEKAEAVFVSSPPRPGQFSRALTKIAETGAATPVGGTFSTAPDSPPVPSVFFSPRITANGTVSFIGNVTTADNKTINAIFAVRSGGVLEKVVADGDATPGGPLMLQPSGHSMNADGDVAFVGLEQGQGALYLWRNGVIRRLVAPGQPLAAGGLLTPSALVPPVLINSGRVFFLGSLVNNPARFGLFSVDSN